MSLRRYEPAELPTDPREAKLPAWARELIDRTRHIANGAITIATGAINETDIATARVVLDPLGLGAGVPNSVREIGFRVPVPGHPNWENTFITVRPTLDGDGNPTGIDVHGKTALVIRPWVTNVVKITHAERG
jgi:hypothetical protein